MAKQTIDTGTAGNPATGDTLRTAMTKVNANFDELYITLASTDDNGGLLTTSVTNGDMRIQPNGTGVVEIDKLQITDDDITSIVTNGNIAITGNGTGGVTVEGITFKGTSMASSDSSTINVNENLIVDGNLTVSGSISGSLSIANVVTFVGDDSTGTAIDSGETFKIAGTQNITTAVSGDTLTITGPDLSSYATQAYVDARDIGDLSVVGSTISAPSNATLTLTTSGTGNISLFDNTSVQGTLGVSSDITVDGTFNRIGDFTFSGTSISSGSSTAININEQLNVDGAMEVGGDILPAADNTQYLGSASKRWHTLYVGPGSINIAGASITNVGGILKIPGGVEGTQGLSGLFVDPTSLPYGGENDVLGSLFNYDGTTVFYEQSTWTNIKYYVENVAGYSGWVVGDALPTDPITGTFDDPSGNTIVPATFSATTSGNNLVSLKLLTGGSGLGAGATDNILAFRVGDPITTYAVTPYGGVLGTANPQGTIQSDSTFTGSVNVNSNLFLHDSVDAYNTISMNSNKITDLGTPTATTDAATKGYVDTQLSSSSHNITFVGDDSTGTAVTQGETFKFAGATGITTAVSGDTLTITGTAQDFAFGSLTGTPTTLSGYGITDAVATGSTAVTVVGDDSTGTSFNIGETLKVAGATGITTAVSGDTLTITGPTTVSVASAVSIISTTSTDTEFPLLFVSGAGNNTPRVDATKLTFNPSSDTLSVNSATITSTKISNWDTAFGWGDHGTEGYLTGTGTQTIDNISFNDNIISTASNADLNLNPGGTGQVVTNSALKINKGYIEAINTLTSSSTITVDFSEASVHTVTLAENTEFVVTNLPTGGTGTIIITQDGGGSNTGSFGTDGSTAVKFAGGTPTLSTAGNAIDVVTIFNDGTNYLGNIAKAYAA